MIHICMITDESYLQMCRTSIYDIIIHKNPETELYFHILCDKINDVKVFDIFKQIPNVTLSTIDCNSDKEMYVNREYGLAFYMNNKSTYLRYLIPELEEFKNIGKVLYLDCDILVRKDLSELYNIDMGDYPLAGVKKPRMDCYTNGKFENQYPWYDVVNMGILLMNLDELRKTCFTKRCLTETFSSGLNDEIIINTLYFNKIKFIDYIYNVEITKCITNTRGFRDVNLLNDFYNVNYISLNEFLKSIVIAHYTGAKSKVAVKKPLSLLLDRLQKRFDTFLQTKQVEFVQEYDDDTITILEQV